MGSNITYSTRKYAINPTVQYLNKIYKKGCVNYAMPEHSFFVFSFIGRYLRTWTLAILCGADLLADFMF